MFVVYMHIYLLPCLSVTLKASISYRHQRQRKDKSKQQQPPYEKIQPKDKDVRTQKNGSSFFSHFRRLDDDHPPGDYYAITIYLHLLLP